MPFPNLSSRRRESAAGMPFIMLAVLIDMVSIGLIVPVLPSLVGGFTDSPADQAFWFGAVLFAFGIANFVGSPVLGALSDIHGRRPVLLLGFCGLALNFIVTGLAGSLWVLAGVRLVGGAMQANAAVANAYVADITEPAERAKRFGMLGAMFGVGFIIGPVMGGLLGAIDLRLPFFVAGGMALLNLLYGYFVLPESLPPERRKRFSWRALSPFASLRDLAGLQGVGWLVAVVGLSSLAQFVQISSWVLFTGFKFGWGPLQNGWSLAAVGAMSVIVQGFLFGKLLRRFKPRQLAIAGLASSAMTYLAMGGVPRDWMLFVAIGCNVLGYTVAASLQSIVSAAADARDQGRALGAVNSVNSLTSVVAPMIGPPLLAVVSHYPAGDWRIGVPLYFCAALQTVAMVLAILHFRRQRRRG